MEDGALWGFFLNGMYCVVGPPGKPGAAGEPGLDCKQFMQGPPGDAGVPGPDGELG